MKTLLLLTTSLILFTVPLFGKYPAESHASYYHSGISFVNSGSGHGPGYTLGMGVVKGRKSLELGLIIGQEEMRITGADLKYRIYLGTLQRLEARNTFITPYLQYNILYEKSISYAVDVVNLGGETYEIQTEPGIVTTMGHYLSYGNKIQIFKRAYLDTSVGIGVYQGSLDPVNGPGTWGIHKENHGFTYSYKLGIYYMIN